MDAMTHEALGVGCEQEGRRAPVLRTGEAASLWAYLTLTDDGDAGIVHTNMSARAGRSCGHGRATIYGRVGPGQIIIRT